MHFGSDMTSLLRVDDVIRCLMTSQSRRYVDRIGVKSRLDCRLHWSLANTSTQASTYLTSSVRPGDNLHADLTS